MSSFKEYEVKLNLTKVILVGTCEGKLIDIMEGYGKVPGRARCILQSSALLVRLLQLLDYVELHIGLGGQPIALPTSLLAEPPDVISFLKHFVRDMKFKNGERVSYFAIRVAVGCPD